MGQNTATKFLSLAKQTKGPFHSTKHSEIFETGTNGTEISREKFQKIRKFTPEFLVEWQSPENSHI